MGLIRCPDFSIPSTKCHDWNSKSLWNSKNIEAISIHFSIRPAFQSLSGRSFWPFFFKELLLREFRNSTPSQFFHEFNTPRNHYFSDRKRFFSFSSPFRIVLFNFVMFSNLKNLEISHFSNFSAISVPDLKIHTTKCHRTPNQTHTYTALILSTTIIFIISDFQVYHGNHGGWAVFRVSSECFEAWMRFIPDGCDGKWNYRSAMKTEIFYWLE